MRQTGVNSGTSLYHLLPKVLNLLVKISLFGLIIFIIFAQNLPRFSGKGILFRVFTFPLAALIIPIFQRFQFRHKSYPHLAEAFILLPFVIDLFGNAANLYDTVWFFDNFAHFGNWLFLVSGFGILISSFRLGRFHLALLALGVGTVAHTIWEIGEYIGMKLGVSRLYLSYEDTISDIILALAGSLLGALLTATWFYRKNN